MNNKSHRRLNPRLMHVVLPERQPALQAPDDPRLLGLNRALLARTPRTMMGPARSLALEGPWDVDPAAPA
jgi:hypothetical protein